jgi:hypothetical protein
VELTEITRTLWPPGVRPVNTTSLPIVSYLTGDDVVVTIIPSTEYFVDAAPTLEVNAMENPSVVEPLAVGAGGAAGAVLIRKVAGGEEGIPEGLRGITVIVYREPGFNPVNVAVPEMPLSTMPTSDEGFVDG